MSRSEDELLLSVDVGIEFTFLSQAFETKFSTPILVKGASVSKPVAITVITISSPNDSSITDPQIIFASGSTLLWTNSAAVLISCNPKSLPPVMLIITPLAPSIDVSVMDFELLV